MAQASFEDCEKTETEVQKRNVELQQLQAQEASSSSPYMVQPDPASSRR